MKSGASPTGKRGFLYAARNVNDPTWELAGTDRGRSQRAALDDGPRIAENTRGSVEYDVLGCFGAPGASSSKNVSRSGWAPTRLVDIVVWNEVIASDATAEVAPRHHGKNGRDRYYAAQPTVAELRPLGRVRKITCDLHGGGWCACGVGHGVTRGDVPTQCRVCGETPPSFFREVVGAAGFTADRERSGAGLEAP